MSIQINAIEHMTIEQKKLLHEIASWHSKQFYNEMNDHWTSEDYNYDRQCENNIKKLEKEYKEKYGDLPEWEYIDDVWEAIKSLEKELNK
jgi:hypothetical protein